MPKYERIKQICNAENKNMISVLRYIASIEGYLSEGNIQYKKMFNSFLKPKFVETANRYDESSNCISRRQYNCLRKYRHGKFPINICIYLQTLYELMIGYEQKADIAPRINDISYSEYILNYLREQIIYIVVYNNQNENGNNNTIDGIHLNYFRTIYDEIIALDNACGENKLKIYNNIW
ncbi:MAG: hypothetical protein J5854_07405 [Clostridia bacterium]|jgi:hypothetical protein|nr:hypothetical protein [Clostridia bacterium]